MNPNGTKWNQMEPLFGIFRYFVLGVGSGLAHFSHSLVRCGGRPPSHFGIRDEAHRGVHVCHGPGAWSSWMSLHKLGWNGLLLCCICRWGCSGGVLVMTVTSTSPRGVYRLLLLFLDLFLDLSLDLSLDWFSILRTRLCV